MITTPTMGDTAGDGYLSRVDVIATPWVAPRIVPDLVTEQQVVSYAGLSVHQQISRQSSRKAAH
jgi:hypothetical protein